MSNVTIESASAEPVDVDLVAASDPTGDLPEFQLTTTGVSTPTGSWVDGSWLTSWTTGRMTARTPTIGAAGTLTVVEGERYTLWVRWGTVVKKACIVTVQ